MMLDDVQTDGQCKGSAAQERGANESPGTAGKPSAPGPAGHGRVPCDGSVGHNPMCEKVDSLMLEFLANELPSEVYEKVSRHLDGCTRCHNKLFDVLATLEMTLIDGGRAE